ncbi:uncharacterized protein A4U43_C07F33570, partial [Asparagus officinalis]
EQAPWPWIIYREAANKYLLAKNNLKGILSAEMGTLQLQCSLNLMSCYLKTGQLEECIKEGSEVLVYDANNVKALYRRGQAYKELGNLELDCKVSLMSLLIHLDYSRLIIEEIDEEETDPVQPESEKISPSEWSLSEPAEASELSENGRSNNGASAADVEYLKSLRDSPEAIRSFQNYISNANPDELSAMGVGELPPDMIKTASGMIGKMKPEELQKMLEVASSLKGKAPNFPNTNGDGSKSESRLSSQIPEMTPEMVKMASDRMSNMSLEEVQKKSEIASSMNLNGFPSNPTSENTTQRSESGYQASTAEGSHTMDHLDARESSSDTLFSNPRNAQASSSHPGSSADLQETLRNSMKDPVMRQMFTSMMKSISPEMMVNMSDQYGMKLSKEDAAKARQTMSSLSPEELDKMVCKPSVDHIF